MQSSKPLKPPNPLRLEPLNLKSQQSINHQEMTITLETHQLKHFEIIYFVYKFAALGSL